MLPLNFRHFKILFSPISNIHRLNTYWRFFGVLVIATLCLLVMTGTAQAELQAKVGTFNALAGTGTQSIAGVGG